MGALRALGCFILSICVLSGGVFADSPSNALLSPEAFGQIPLSGRDIFSFEGKSGLADGWLSLPFASDKKIDRVCFDANVNLDLSALETPLLGVTVENPKAVGSITLYFRSGDGWYSMGRKASGPMNPNRPVQLVFSISEARTEGKPAGLDKIDGIRIAFWRGNDVDSRVRLNSFQVQEYGFLSVVADPEKWTGDAGHGPRQVRMLARYGIATTQINASALTAARLASARAVIIPITASLTDEQVGVLCDYVDGGGFVVLCYTQPARLMNRLGFTAGRYTKPKADEPKLAEIHFLPGREKTSASNVITRSAHNAAIARPLPDDQLPEQLRSDEAKPKIDAFWQDSDGNRTDLPAIVSSESGIFWSYLFPSDDAATRQYLESVFGALDPTIPRAAARKVWGELFSVGYDPTLVADADAFRQKALEEILPRLALDGWTEAKIKAILFDQADVAESEKFILAVEKVRDERVTQFCASFASKPVEARLWWQHSGLGPYPGDWDRTMKELSEAGFNAVIPNMLWGGSAMYESDVLPHDPSVEKYGDQAAQAVAAGKKYGVQVHVWKVNYNCGRTPQSFIDEMTAAGRMQKSYSGEPKPWLCPSNELNQKLEADSMLEVATKYGVDGIHFDYIRYDGGGFCYCDGCRQRFGAFYREQTGEELADWPESTRRDEKVRELWGQWRCDQITALVREVRRRVEIECPTCQISAAVFSDYPGCTKGIAQDWVKWVHEGLLDFICPMDYTASPVRFDSLIKKQQELIGGKIPLYPGIGATSTGNSLSADQVAVQIEIARRNNTPGFTIFNLSQREAAKYFSPLSSGPTKEKSAFK